MSLWQTLKTEVILENEYLRFLVDEFQVNGKIGKYFYHTNAYGDSAVSVFIQKTDNVFYMIKEYRYLFNEILLTNVQGSIEKDEDPKSAAIREVLEESGYETGEMIHIGTHATAPSFSKERTHVFLAKKITQKEQSLDENEDIEVVEMSVFQIEEAIKNGEIWDGQAIAGWYMVKNHLEL